MSNVEKHKNGDYILTPLKENDEVLDGILGERYMSQMKSDTDKMNQMDFDEPIEEAVNPNMLKMFGVEEAMKMMVAKMREAIKSGKVKDAQLGALEDIGEMVGKMFVKAANDAVEANKE